MRKKIVAMVLILVAGILIIFGITWFFSNQVLYPSWKAPNLAVCTKNFIDEEWGPDCGNLRLNKKYKFNEITVRSENGRLGGWHIPHSCNNPLNPKKKSAMFFLHGGGADRRQGYRFIEFFISRGYDVYLFDLSGHGESESRYGKISLGEREYKDAVAIYHFLEKQYDTILAVGTSMGAVSILNALDDLSGISGIIVENPFYSSERLILELPLANILPRWIKSMAFRMICLRSNFTPAHSPARALLKHARIPILFIHSKEDTVIPYQQSVDLYRMYQGPKELLLTDSGQHAAIIKTHKDVFFSAIDKFIKNSVNTIVFHLQ